MKKIILIAFLILSKQLSAQINNTFYGLARKNTPNNELFLATINPSTGTVTNISQNSLSPIVNLTGAALDPYRNYYHFIGYNEIKTIDLTTGNETNSAIINNPIKASYFDNFRFNNSDSSLYGLARSNYFDTVTNTNIGEVYLATINTTTGVISQISNTSVAQGYALAGSAINPYLMVYYFSTGSNLMGLDMYNGNIYTNVPILLANQNMQQHFDNFTYSCVDTSLYGLIRTNYFSKIYDSTLMDSIEVLDSTGIQLGKINPSTGVVTFVSPHSIAQGGYSLNAGSTIDPTTKIFYYNNGYQLIGVSLTTGLIVSQAAINNLNGQFFELMRIQSNCFEATLPNRLNPNTSVSQIKSNSNTISIFPNPINNELNVLCDNEIKKIEIMDAMGKLIWNQNFQSSTSVKINLENQPKGIYFLKCTSNNSASITKFIK